MSGNLAESILTSASYRAQLPLCKLCEAARKTVNLFTAPETCRGEESRTQPADVAEKFLAAARVVPATAVMQQRPLSATAVAAMVLAAGPKTTAVAAGTVIAVAAATAVPMMAVTAASDDWRSFRRVFSMSVNNDYLHENSISEALV